MKLSSYGYYNHRSSRLNALKNTSCNYALSDYNSYPIMLSRFKHRRTTALSSKLYTINQITFSDYSDQVINFVNKIKIGPLKLISSGT